MADANQNGVDDSKESNDENRTTAQTSGQTDPAALNQMNYGVGALSAINDIYQNPGAEGDEGYTNMRNAFQFSMADKMFSSMLANYQSELSMAQNLELMGAANRMDRQTMQESRNQIAGLNWLTMDKQFELNDQFANNDLYRNLSYMGGLGEQTRLNYAAEGQQQRLGMITAGEQQRLGIAAMGEQSRLGTIVAGEQQRLGIAATGVETRKNIAAQGTEDRLGYRVQGDEQRKNISATGIENRAQARTEGLEQRKNIKATGVENRLQAVTEGEQKRLNIGKTADEQRSTMTHSDNIAAGREKRQHAAARAAARSM